MIPEQEPGVFTRVLYGCEADEITETVILTPIDSFLEDLKARAENVRETGGFCKGFLGEFNGVKCAVFNSRVGSPAASDSAYYLRFTPCNNIIFTGLIGALQPEIKIGDVIVPTASLRGEGASKYLVDEAYPAVADYGLLREASGVLEKAYAGLGIGVHYGPIYTTDSFAAETPEFLEKWSSTRLLGIEMETSAIYVIGSLYGMKAAALHIVSDNPMTKKSFFDPIPEAEKERRKLSTGILMDSLVELVGKI
jgi:uridine phosphorylase